MNLAIKVVLWTAFTCFVLYAVPVSLALGLREACRIHPGVSVDCKVK